MWNARFCGTECFQAQGSIGEDTKPELKITADNLKLDVGTDFPISSVKLPVSSFEAAASQESTPVMQS